MVSPAAWSGLFQHALTLEKDKCPHASVLADATHPHHFARLVLMSALSTEVDVASHQIFSSYESSQKDAKTKIATNAYDGSDWLGFEHPSLRDTQPMQRQRPMPQLISE